MKKIQLHCNSLHLMYIVVGIFSAVVFCTIYGIRILNPTYIDWLLCGSNDLTQHYLGWKAYRSSEWHIQLGLIDTLAYPHKTSIIFTDSIPLVAVLFKLFSPVLPYNFQYFGVYGILCFVIQGILAARIIKNFSDNKIVVVISSFMFLYTPVMLYRMFVHTALASQWIILLGLEPIFVHKKYQNNKKLYFIVALMALFSASIHIYFVLMSGIILMGICLTDLIIYKNVKRSVIVFVEYLFIVVFVIWLLGGFYGESVTAGGGLGSYSFNINAFFNPQGWSCIFKSLLLYGDKQYEGFAWLGAGFVVLLIFALVLFPSSKNALQNFITNKKECAILCIVSLTAVLVALSPVVTFGDKILLNMKLPDFVVRLWSVFRSSGRVAWIAVYIIMLCCCIVVSRILDKRALLILMLFGLGFQVYDIHIVIRWSYEKYSQPMKYDLPMDTDSIWGQIAWDQTIEHIVYCSDIDRNIMFSLADWALDHKKTINNFYFARSNSDIINKSTVDSLLNPSENEIFIFTNTDRVKMWEYDKLHYYEANEFIIGYVNSIDGFEELIGSDKCLIWNFGGGQYMHEGSGADTEKGRELYADGVSYGPYWEVLAGNYIITLTGEGLDESVNVVPYSGHGTVYYDYSVISNSDSQIILSFSLDEAVSDLEIFIGNGTQRTILLKEIELQKNTSIQ